MRGHAVALAGCCLRTLSEEEERSQGGGALRCPKTRLSRNAPRTEGGLTMFAFRSEIRRDPRPDLRLRLTALGLSRKLNPLALIHAQPLRSFSQQGPP